MNLKRTGAIFSILPILLVGTWSMPASGIELPPNLRYEVSVKDGEIETNHSIWVTAHLINQGTAPVQVVWGDRAYDDQYIHRFIYEDGTVLPPPRDGLLPHAAGIEAGYLQVLRPGGSLRYQMSIGNTLGANTQDFYFRKPGRYRLEPSFQVVLVEPYERMNGTQDYRETWRGILDAKPVEFTVVPRDNASKEANALNITGRVVDPEGKPVPGAYVEIRSRHNSQPFDRVETGESGTFAFESLYRGNTYYFLSAKHPHYIGMKHTVTNTPPELDYDVELVLRGGVRARGIVVDEVGKPLAGVRIRYGLEKQTYSDGEGQFELTGLDRHGVEELGLGCWRRGYVKKSMIPLLDATREGHLRIVMGRKKTYPLTGVARLSDGTPLDHVRLTFDLTGGASEEHRIREHQLRPDGNGRFTLDLERPGTFSGEVWARSTSDSRNAEGRWKAEVENLESGQTDRAIFFESRGEIRVSVLTSETFSPDRTVRLTCVQTKEGVRIRDFSFEYLERPISDAVHTYRHLAPGRYTVGLQDTEVSGLNWKREVEIPGADGEWVQEVLFELPDIEFGNIRARFVGSDSHEPVGEGTVSINTHGRTDYYQFTGGEIELNQIPTGKFFLGTRVDGYMRENVQGEVLPGETTDLGDVVLTSEAEGAGWVEGRVLYEDGTPVLGAGWGGDGFSTQAVDSDGRYRLRLPVGEQKIAFEFKGASLWPRSAATAMHAQFGMHGGTIIANQNEDKLFVEVDVRPGKILERDIRISREGLGDISVEWPDGQEHDGRYYFLVRTDEGLYSCDSGIFPYESKSQLEDVPAGDRLLVFQAGGYGGYQEVADATGDTVFRLDASRAGSVRGTIKSATGSEKPAKVILLPPVPPDLHRMQGMRSIYHLNLYRPHFRAEVSPAGEFVFPGVEPNRYRLLLDGEDVGEVVVKAGAETAVTFDVGI